MAVAITRTEDGEVRFIREPGGPLYEAGGEPIGIRGTIQDVTKQKRTQAQLIQSSKLATLGEMAAAMAHELNQPLNVIRMAADSTIERIEEGKADAQYLGVKLGRISAQTERAARIIDHMRIFGREMGEKPEAFDPRQVVNDALGLSVSYGIISDMGGTIDAANARDGAVLTITLPAVAERRPAA